MRPAEQSSKQKSIISSRAQAFSGCLAVDRGANGLHANHSIFERAEATHTGLVQSDRNRGGIALNGRSTTLASCGKVVAAARRIYRSQTPCHDGSNVRFYPVPGIRSSVPILY
jgi:hypothetical protein